MSNPYFINAKLNSLTNNINLADSNANYKNAGYRMDTAITNSTIYSSGTSVAKITKTNSDRPTNIQSNIVPHVINKVSIQDETGWNPGIEVIRRWTDNAVDISSNQAQFKIWNLALPPSSSSPVYTIGKPTDFSVKTGETNLFDISRNNRQDAYSRDGYDIANLGFWYSENIQYKINFSTISILGENLYNPLRYELRSYYNETGGGVVSSNPTGSTIILENTANANNYIYFDNLSGVPSIVKNGANMIQYTTNNKINGIPNLHLFSDKTFSIRLKYLVNNYSTRFLLDKSKNVLKHQFSYSSTDLYDISWNSHTAVAPSIATNGYQRAINYWDISQLPITSAPDFIGPAKAEITLKITATNTFGTSDFIIDNSTNSIVHKFIYDEPTITEFNVIRNSLVEIPSGFKPSFGVGTGEDVFTPTNYNSFGSDSTNNLQMSMWNGFFYSDEGWKKETDISGSNIKPYNISESAPVFSGNTDDYKWVIFKYTCSKSYTAAYKLALGFSSGHSNITLSSIVAGDVKIFANFNRIDSYKSGSYYWLNIGQSDGGITPPNASSQAYNYEGNLRFTPADTTSSANFINGSSMKASFLPNVSNPVLDDYERLIGALFNSINTSSNKTIFIAVGIKNSSNFRTKKPHVWLSDGDTNESFFKLT